MQKETADFYEYMLKFFTNLSLKFSGHVKLTQDNIHLFVNNNFFNNNAYSFVILIFRTDDDDGEYTRID